VVSLRSTTGYKLGCLRHPRAPRQTSDRLTLRILKAVFLELCPSTLPQVGMGWASNNHHSEIVLN
jgi:hypothetical protein